MAAKKAIAAIISVLADESSDEDDNDDEMATVLLPALALACCRNPRVKIQGYAETTVPKYLLDDFKRFFRISLGTFETVCQYLMSIPDLKPSGNGGRPPVPLETKVLVTLWYLGTLDTLHRIADRFGITEFSVIRCRNSVTKVLVNNMKQLLIEWPKDAEKNTIATEFEQKKGFPDIIGATNGTHIKIQSPHDNPDSYVNRKNFHSVVLQGVCREDTRFIHCYSGWPGSVHDARVLRNSDLWDSGLQMCGRYHLLGDGAYPIRRWLLTPYRDTGHLDQRQKHFTYCLSNSRVVVERAFGLLKGRFRRLQHVDVKDMALLNQIIIGSCILHNICILGEDQSEEYFTDPAAPTRIPNVFLQENDAEGALKRDMISRRLP